MRENQLTANTAREPALRGEVQGQREALPSGGDGERPLSHARRAVARRTKG